MFLIIDKKLSERSFGSVSLFWGGKPFVLRFLEGFVKSLARRETVVFLKISY